ncbi:MAG: DNA repair protein RecN [Acidobacteriota bacterium]
MLSLLKIRRIALIDEAEIEFGRGLNLLTGETGSGKSIIVDSLGALTGDRISSDLIKEGEDSAQIEGIFVLERTRGLTRLLDEAGIDVEPGNEFEIIVRRDLSLAGRNRIFVNNQLVTNAFLKQIGSDLVDIHGQGEQAALYDTSTHIDMLDEYGNLTLLRQKVAETHKHWSATKAELGMLEQNESEKLKRLDILRFQAGEIEKANLQTGEERELETEKLKLNNVEKLSRLADEAFALLYENDTSALSTLDKGSRDIGELAEFDQSFGLHKESLANARAAIEDAAYFLRDFRGRLEFSPERLEEIENRLAEISRIKRKYGESIEDVLHHLNDSKAQIENIETAEFREEELKKKLAERRAEYVKQSGEIHAKRAAAARKFEKQVESDLKAVALEKARFEVRIEAPENRESDSAFTAKGFDRVEFYFSANPGESLKPLAKVASGGEASRLMLILKTAARSKDREKTAVFDEIDVGIGGRVAEAVGLKLKELARTQQVLCVTHQPQIASLADKHFVVEKTVTTNKTSITTRELDKTERVEEIARMLAGEKISDTAREHARELLAATS